MKVSRSLDFVGADVPLGSTLNAEALVQQLRLVRSAKPSGRRRSGTVAPLLVEEGAATEHMETGPRAFLGGRFLYDEPAPRG